MVNRLRLHPVEMLKFLMGPQEGFFRKLPIADVSKIDQEDWLVSVPGSPHRDLDENSLPVFGDTVEFVPGGSRFPLPSSLVHGAHPLPVFRVNNEDDWLANNLFRATVAEHLHKLSIHILMPAILIDDGNPVIGMF